MAKWLILFLSFWMMVQSGICQQSAAPAHCDCSSKRVQDSLVVKYLDNGAEKYNYNGPEWQLYCDSLISICPNISEAYQHKAIPYIKYGDYAKAFALENKAVEHDPARWTAYRGFLKCIFTKDYEGALVDFKEAQRLTPNSYEMDHTYFFYQALCNLELGNYKLAEENFKQDAIVQQEGKTDTIDRVHYNSYMYRGILYYELNRNSEAKACLLKSIKIYPQLPEANYYLAMIFKKEKNDTERKKYLELARAAKLAGYSISEDNIFYAYYPHQITLYEINQELK